MLGDSAADWDEDRGVTLVRWEVGPTSTSSPDPPSSLLPPPPPPPPSLADTDHPCWLLVISVEEHNDRINTWLTGHNCLGKKSLWNFAKYFNSNLLKLQCSSVALFDIPEGVPWSMNWISTFQWISWKVFLWIFLNFCVKVHHKRLIPDIKPELKSKLFSGTISSVSSL